MTVAPDPTAFDTEIRGLTSDSRRVEPGFLFAALPGTATDGRQYIADAISRGAIAVLAVPGTRLDPSAGDVKILTDKNPRRQFAFMAARFYGRQPRHLAAVTGTNGKTSVAEFTRQIWAALGHRAASLGTLGAIGPDKISPGTLTTPDPVELHRILCEMADDGIDKAVIEASSHGLDQYRLDGARVTVAAFTNLGRDHLDYHETLEAYLNAKLRLFTEILGLGGVAVLNADDPNFAMISETAEVHRQRVLSYGRAGKDIRLVDLRPLSKAQHLELEVFERPFSVKLPLIGEFQAMNALAALGIVLAGNGEAADAVAALEKLEGIPGRIQRVAEHPSGATVYVDYAHTPDALDGVLRALQPHVGREVNGRLIVVFGCGGDRDKGKRRPMGAVAREHADVAIVTDDNPRSEDPARIRKEVLHGCPDAQEIGDRAQAIKAALADLRKGDIVVVAGKGHETGQIVGDKVLPFDDAEVVLKMMAEVTK
jgi:UDP-N-acetylmuramoyl-L-alanyl-D-glutamate--2,6-diaminopimelate ligase